MDSKKSSLALLESDAMTLMRAETLVTAALIGKKPSRIWGREGLLCVDVLPDYCLS